MNDMGIFGFLLETRCLVGVIGFVVSVLIIVGYVKTYSRIKKITEIQEQNLSFQRQLCDMLSGNYKNQKISDQAQFDQWYYDHCFMNNLGPHEWIANGNRTGSDFQFVCKKCGQIINVPVKLQPEHPYSSELKNTKNKSKLSELINNK